MSLNAYPELALAREDMRKQKELYQPSAFWDEASGRITEEFQAEGIENFRHLRLPLSFFVPTYGCPGNAFKKEYVEHLQQALREVAPEAKKAQTALEQFLTGEASARADYRVLLAADRQDRLPYLHHFSESQAGNPVEQFEFDGRKFSRSALNYLLGLALLKKHLKDDEVVKTVVEIGGGFGTLGEILMKSGTDGLRYVDLDIPPTSFAAQYYLSEAVGSDQVTTYAQTRELESIGIQKLRPVSVLSAWQIEKLQGEADLFVNFISFQEMEPPIVQNYLSHVARLKTRWVLLRNIREGKQLRRPGQLAGVETPILGDDYLAMLPDYELVDRNVHPYGFQTVDGFHSELLLLRRKA